MSLKTELSVGYRFDGGEDQLGLGIQPFDAFQFTYWDRHGTNGPVGWCVFLSGLGPTDVARVGNQGILSFGSLPERIIRPERTRCGKAESNPGL